MEYKRIVVQVHKDVTTDEIHKALYDGNVGYCAKDSDWLYEVKETHERADGTPRMTTKQRDRLWELCAGYNVPFREDDYRIQTENTFGSPVGWVEGWVGGFRHDGEPMTGFATLKKTLYVGVDPEGRSHS